MDYARERDVPNLTGSPRHLLPGLSVNRSGSGTVFTGSCHFFTQALGPITPCVGKPW